MCENWLNALSIIEGFGIVIAIVLLVFSVELQKIWVLFLATTFFMSSIFLIVYDNSDNILSFQCSPEDIRQYRKSELEDDINAKQRFLDRTMYQMNKLLERAEKYD